MKQLLSVNQVADLLGRHPKTVRKMVYRGELPTIRVGPHSIRFDPADIEAFIDARRVPAGA